VRHARPRNQKVRRERRICRELGRKVRAACKCPARQVSSPRCIDLLKPLLHLKEAGAPRHTETFERGRRRKADGLIGAALIRNHKIRVQRIQTALPALHGGVKRFQINRDVGARFHILFSSLCITPLYAKGSRKAPINSNKCFMRRWSPLSRAAHTATEYP